MRQVPSGQGRGAAALGPALHPGVLLGLLPPPARGPGVDRKDGAVQHITQFPGGHPRRIRDHDAGDPGRLHIIEPGELINEHLGFRYVDPPGRQRRGDHREAVHGGGEVHQPVSGPAGQRQSHRDLIRDMIRLA